MNSSAPLRSPSGWIAAVLAVSLLRAAPASAQGHSSHKPVIPGNLAHGPDAVSQDVGDVAVMVDNGLIVTSRNLFDLDGSAVRFVPAGDHAFDVSSSPLAFDPDLGTALTFGFSGATRFPGDDDTQSVAFPAGFPFFGTTYTSVWVNTDGNITFGAPDFASSNRDKARQVLGLPRVSGYLHDWNAQNALNPTGSGSIHAVVKSNPDRLVVTWNGVADFEGGVSSTFQITLFSSGAIEIGVAALDPASINGVIGIAEGGGHGPFRNVDLSAHGASVAGGAVLEAFVRYTQVNDQEAAREFYKTHPDQFDFLVLMTDFPVDGFLHSTWVKNQTHGISLPLDGATGESFFPDAVIDFSAGYGSAGELEQFVFMNNVYIFPSNTASLVNPPVEPYREGMNIIQDFSSFGGPVSLDGQTMLQVRGGTSMPPDDGETTRFLLHSGAWYPGIVSGISAMSHEVMHRYGVSPRFIHPTKGNSFDSYDLLGRDLQHWSFFLNAGVPSAQFPDGPRASSIEGNAIVDLGTPSVYDGVATNLAPGERLFRSAPTELSDGYSTLDQYLMGIRRATEVGPMFYVDEPRSLYTNQSLDAFDPNNPLNTAVTMRAWDPMAGIVFKGKRVNLTVQNIKDYERVREGGNNPQGKRFWGPKNNLTVRYFGATGRVDPAGDASVVLSAADRELGDEADRIDANGNPLDVKTMGFILLVREGDPSSHPGAISAEDTVRRVWQEYANGPASGGRGKFDTSLHPVIY